MLVRLHEMASGKKVGPDQTGPAEMTVKNNLLEIAYTIDQAPDEAWRLFGVDLDGCVALGLERVRPNGTQHFTAMEEQMRAAAQTLTEMKQDQMREAELKHLLGRRRD